MVPMKSLGMFMFFFISIHLFKMLSIARALEKIDCNISYYFRYVDDILLSAPSQIRFQKYWMYSIVSTADYSSQWNMRIIKN